MKKSKTFVCGNIMKASIDHDGFKVGRSSKSVYVELSIKDKTSYMLVNGKPCHSFTLLLRGDGERETLTKALEFFVEELKKK